MPNSLERKIGDLSWIIGSFNDLKHQHLSRSNGHLGQLLRKTLKERAGKWDQTVRATAPLLQSWALLKLEGEGKNRSHGRQFNPLSMIGIGETTHSRILGELLDPCGKHGQGMVFLGLFLKGIGVPEPDRGQWKISVESAGVDVCLRRTDPASVIIIENKSNWAQDQASQLYRYWFHQIHSQRPDLDYADEVTKKAFQIIYLSPSSLKRPASGSLMRPQHLSEHCPDHPELPLAETVLTFDEHIARWLDECISNTPATNTRLISFLEFYREIWT